MKSMQDKPNNSHKSYKLKLTGINYQNKTFKIMLILIHKEGKKKNNYSIRLKNMVKIRLNILA